MTYQKNDLVLIKYGTISHIIYVVDDNYDHYGFLNLMKNNQHVYYYVKSFIEDTGTLITDIFRE